MRRRHQAGKEVQAREASLSGTEEYERIYGRPERRARRPTGITAATLGWLGPNGLPVHHYLHETPETCSIGRSLTQDIVLHDETVSREHALVTRDGDDWRVLDVESSNGTVIERRLGEHIAITRRGIIVGGRATLHPGDKLVLGAMRLSFEDPGRAEHEYASVPTKFRVDELTAAEHRVLNALCRPAFRGSGWATNIAIANALCVELTTVRSHMKSLYRKFSVAADQAKDQRRAELVSRAMAGGYVWRDAADDTSMTLTDMSAVAADPARSHDGKRLGPPPAAL